MLVSVLRVKKPGLRKVVGVQLLSGSWGLRDGRTTRSACHRHGGGGPLTPAPSSAGRTRGSGPSSQHLCGTEDTAQASPRPGHLLTWRALSSRAPASLRSCPRCPPELSERETLGCVPRMALQRTDQPRTSPRSSPLGTSVERGIRGPQSGISCKTYSDSRNTNV